MRLLAAVLLISTAAVGQNVLYDNGADSGRIHAWGVNLGYSVTNSFQLTKNSVVSAAQISVWDVNDLNVPKAIRWRITTQPFGGAVLREGTSELDFVSFWCCSYNHLYVWQMKVPIASEASLPAGTYWLQLELLQTTWQTLGFWGESDGPSTAYVLGDGPSIASPLKVGSESFQIIGR